MTYKSGVKDVYRREILRLEPYIKVNNICKEVGISNSAMSYFLKKNRDELISIEKLEKFVNFVNDSVKA